jgi:hypothetical protein
MIYDCEPIRFEYGGKRWLIELWKGQYGMTTGCEIGIYTTKEGAFKPVDEILYDCASDEDILPMAFIVKKNNRVLFKRSAVHWWLTGFILGEFSEPYELSMDIAITFKDKAMLNSFAKALVELGYIDSEIKVLENAILFSFVKPHSPQPRADAELLSRFSQWRNKHFCIKYRRITRNSRDIYEAAAILKRKAPFLYGRILDMAKPFKLFKRSKFRG